jgi:hypothetical protein
MSDIRERYLACWNESDPERRAALLAASWTPDATYVDPLVDVAGRAQIAETIGAVQQQFPGFVFTPVGEVDVHHNVARFSWGLGPAGADPLVIGFDLVTTDAEGRVAGVTGFLDRVPT